MSGPPLPLSPDGPPMVALLASFLSPRSNRRSDRYGDDLLAFPLSVVTAVRAAWHGPLAARLSATSTAVPAAVALREAGVDPRGATVAVQGFGKVGGLAAQFLRDAGCTVVAVSGSPI